MTKLIPYLLLFILLSLGVYVYFDRKSGHDQEVERLLIENQRLRQNLSLKDSLIELSAERELNLKAANMRLQTAFELVKGEAETSKKLLERGKKRKTGILVDSAYAVTLDSLYPGR